MACSIFQGTKELLASPSGVFSLLCLVAITYVTFHAPLIGVGGFVAFFSIVPAALGFFEHREQMAQLQLPIFPQQSYPSPYPQYPSPYPQYPSPYSQYPSPTNTDLPNRGQL